MNLSELFRSGHLLWGVFLIIALVFLVSSVSRYRRSGARADLPRVLTDTLAATMVVGAVLHLGLGVPHPTPLLVLYGLVLGGLFAARMKVVQDVTRETRERQEAMAEANRARQAAGSTEEPDAGTDGSAGPSLSGGSPVP